MGHGKSKPLPVSTQYPLVLFLIPLFAERMLLRECVVLCLGTAHRIGGRSSRRPARPARVGREGRAGRERAERSGAADVEVVDDDEAAGDEAAGEGAAKKTRATDDSAARRGVEVDGRARASEAIVSGGGGG